MLLKASIKPLAAGLVTFFFLGCYRFAKLGLDEYIDQLALPPSQEEAMSAMGWLGDLLAAGQHGHKMDRTRLRR